MSIATSAGMTALADGLTVTPTAQKLSKFEVAEDEDSVVIAARQGDVTVSDGQQTSTVPEGQQTTRKKKPLQRQAVVTRFLVKLLQLWREQREPLRQPEL
jgi:ferric-dicitrate binding protein FerR (iron transport regulator)